MLDNEDAKTVQKCIKICCYTINVYKWIIFQWNNSLELHIILHAVHYMVMLMKPSFISILAMCCDSIPPPFQKNISVINADVSHFKQRQCLKQSRNTKTGAVCEYNCTASITSTTGKFLFTLLLNKMAWPIVTRYLRQI